MRIEYLACIHVLDPDEFQDMSKSLAIVFKAVDERTSTLEAVFKSTSTDIETASVRSPLACSSYHTVNTCMTPINNRVYGGGWL
ncbi:hypothetical protein B0H14DRAFT_3509724 [Mycena olivaceomarginata]|nr:hypothetical protein B0H14DRAFT_3509724 [Mycena olivaceomarginata]